MGAFARTYGLWVRHWTLEEATAALPDVRDKVQRIRELARARDRPRTGQGARLDSEIARADRRAPGATASSCAIPSVGSSTSRRSRRRARPTCCAGSTARTRSSGGTGPTPASPGPHADRPRRRSSASASVGVGHAGALGVRERGADDPGLVQQLRGHDLGLDAFSRGRNLSAFLLIPPPTMKRSGENSASTIRKYSSRRPAHSFHDRFSSSRTLSDGAAPRRLSCPSSGGRARCWARACRRRTTHCRCPVPEGDHDHDARRGPCPRRRSISAIPAASASLTTVTSPPIASVKSLRGVGADPRLVDVRRAVGDAALDDGGERGSGGAGPVEERGHLGDHVGDRVGRRRVRGEDAVAVGEQLTAAGVDGRALDAGAADVDAEHCRHGVIHRPGSPRPGVMAAGVWETRPRWRSASSST